MSAKSEQNIRVRNTRQQPVELHLPGRVVVLSPAGAAELEPGEIASPQVQVLLRHRLIQIEASQPAPAESAMAESSAGSPRRRSPRGSSNVEGDK